MAKNNNKATTPETINVDESKVEKIPTEKATFTKSDVEKMIKEAIVNLKEEQAPKVVKKVKTHIARMYRFNNEWVVGFKDQNTDPYSTSVIHAYNQFNEKKREEETWIELVFEDGKTQKVPLLTYLTSRVPVDCEIVKREDKDISKVIGNVERTKVDGYKTIATGIEVEQLVEMTESTYTLKRPDGSVVELPEYILA